MEKENFDTIETDLQIAKQQFSEAKYIIYETGSFNVFLERLSKNQFKDPKISIINKEAKEKLVEVKNTSRKYDEEIKAMSIALYNECEEIKELEEKENSLEKEINDLQIKNLEIEQRESANLEIIDLQEKLKESEKEREVLLQEIRMKRDELEGYNCIALQEKAESLIEKKESLLEQEREIQKDKNDLEDLYSWYKNGFELIEKLFGYKYEGCKVEGSNTFVNLSLNGNSIQLVLEEGVLKDIKSEEYDWVKILKEISIK
ncbi:hypothetical protein H311_03366, partial [Anncaliia algerae PRA109]